MIHRTEFLSVEKLPNWLFVLIIGKPDQADYLDIDVLFVRLNFFSIEFGPVDIELLFELRDFLSKLSFQLRNIALVILNFFFCDSDITALLKCSSRARHTRRTRLPSTK